MFYARHLEVADQYSTVSPTAKRLSRSRPAGSMRRMWPLLSSGATGSGKSAAGISFVDEETIIWHRKKKGLEQLTVNARLRQNDALHQEFSLERFRSYQE